MEIIRFAVAIIITLSLVIVVHEIGHLVVALKSGVKVETFSIGFGPELLGWNKNGVRYKVSAVPLGGYVKMKGDNLEEDEAFEPDSFLGLSPLKRIPILMAGSLMNLITGAFIMFLVLWISGMPYLPDEPLVGQVRSGSPAEEAGIQKGDRVVEIEGKKIKEWERGLASYIGRETEVKIERDGQLIEMKLIPEYDLELERVVIGFSTLYETERLGVIEAFITGIRFTGEMVFSIIAVLWLIISGEMAPELMGVIGLGDMVAQAVRVGIAPLFELIAIISINLGVINLLPVPVLDGGHIVMAIIERLKGSSLKPKEIAAANMVGLVLILLLFIYVSWQDILRLIE